VKIRLWLFGCLLVSANASASGHSVLLTWTQSGSPNIVSNEVNCGHVSGGPYPWHRTTRYAATSMTVQNVNSGTFYCMVTATNDLGEVSIASNEVEVDVP
jgi:hypothetical protein